MILCVPFCSGNFWSLVIIKMTGETEEKKKKKKKREEREERETREEREEKMEREGRKKSRKRIALHHCIASLHCIIAFISYNS